MRERVVFGTGRRDVVGAANWLSASGARAREKPAPPALRRRRRRLEWIAVAREADRIQKGRYLQSSARPLLCTVKLCSKGPNNKLILIYIGFTRISVYRKLFSLLIPSTEVYHIISGNIERGLGWVAEFSTETENLKFWMYQLTAAGCRSVKAFSLMRSSILTSPSLVCSRMVWMRDDAIMEAFSSLTVFSFLA